MIDLSDTFSTHHSKPLLKRTLTLKVTRQLLQLDKY